MRNGTKRLDPIEMILAFGHASYTHFLKRRFDVASGYLALRKVKDRGRDCAFLGKAQIAYPEQLKLGDFVQIGSNAFLFCKGGLWIGTGTIISRNLCVYTANHDVSARMLPYDDSYVCKGVKIGENVWIGMNVNICPGVTIGNGAIIGMGTTVSKDVPDGAIVVGSAQRVVGTRDMTAYAELNQARKFFGQHFPPWVH